MQLLEKEGLEVSTARLTCGSCHYQTPVVTYDTHAGRLRLCKWCAFHLANNILQDLGYTRVV